MTLDDFIQRADQLLESIDQLLVAAARRAEGGVLSTLHTSTLQSVLEVDGEGFAQWRAATLSLFTNLFGTQHTYYQEFQQRSRNSLVHNVRAARGVLKAARDELAGGWLQTAKGLVAAEIFSDFLDMATHLLSEGYKDPAAVMVGSVLEEHLRQLGAKHGVSTDQVQKGKTVPKKADRLNADLAKAAAYNKLDHKSITGWLDLRNNAAHGHYGEYSKEQVELMVQGVLDFMARVSV